MFVRQLGRQCGAVVAASTPSATSRLQPIIVGCCRRFGAAQQLLSQPPRPTSSASESSPSQPSSASSSSSPASPASSPASSAAQPDAAPNDPLAGVTAKSNNWFLSYQQQKQEQRQQQQYHQEQQEAHFRQQQQQAPDHDSAEQSRLHMRLSSDHEPWLIQHQINLTTRNYREGHVIVSELGIVAGTAARTRSIFHDLWQRIKGVIGGTLYSYEELIASTTADATLHAMTQAHQLGANTIVRIHYQCTTTDSKLTGVSCFVICYGTAVFDKPREGERYQ